MVFSHKDFEATPIVAYGCVFLVTMLAILLFESFWKYESIVSNELRDVQQEFATLESLKDENPWVERFQSSQLLRQRIIDGRWVGTTTGVVAAEFQQLIRGVALDLNFDTVQVQVDPEPFEIVDHQVLSFEFSGRAPDGKIIVSLLEDVAKHSKYIIIQDVDFTQNLRDGGRPRLAFSGIIPIEIVSIKTQNTQNGPDGSQ